MLDPLRGVIMGSALLLVIVAMMAACKVWGQIYRARQAQQEALAALDRVTTGMALVVPAHLTGEQRQMFTWITNGVTAMLVGPRDPRTPGLSCSDYTWAAQQCRAWEQGLWSLWRQETV